MTEVIDKKTCQVLRNELQRIIEESKDYDSLNNQFDIKVGNASFDSQEVTFKLTLRLKNAESKESMDLDRYADLYNVVPQKVADVHGIKYKLVGYRVKARKQPFIVLNLTNNKEYLFTEDLGRKHFGKGEVA
mgnify:FL=1|tara:strand:- start:151 stop:546 length:396 start_codon:yes stop_codon:yes gene_type:complete